MKIIFKYITLYLLLHTSAFAEVEKDKPLQDAIIGTWAQVFENKTMSLKGFTTYNKDGSATGEAIFNIAGKKQIVEISGTWKIHDAHLIMKVTSSSHPQMLPVGHITKDRIIKISEGVYEFETSKNKVIWYL